MATVADVIEVLSFGWVTFLRFHLHEYQNKPWAKRDYGQAIFGFVETPHKIDLMVDGEFFEITVIKKGKRR